MDHKDFERYNNGFLAFMAGEPKPATDQAMELAGWQAGNDQMRSVQFASAIKEK